MHEVARRWIDGGHSVSLYCSRTPTLPARDFDEGVRLFRTGRLKNGRHHLIAPQRLVTEQTPDVIVESINTLPYLLPLRRYASPYVSVVHQLGKDVWGTILPTPVAIAAQCVERALFRPYRGRRMLAVSESTKSDLESIGLGRVVVLPQGGLGCMTPVVKEETLTLLFVGRLIANKRPNHAIESFELIRETVPDVSLWVVGDGPLRERLERTSSPGVVFLGKLSREELDRRMGRAHVLLATSVREGWGLAVTEANALGTPAVAYDVPGLRDSVRAGVTGLLTEPNPRSLAQAALRLCSRKGVYERFRASALDWGRQHSWDTTAEELYRHICAAALEAGGERASA